MGELVPSTIHCQLPSRKSREESQLQASGNTTDSTHADESSSENSQELGEPELGECSPPSKIDGTLVYKNGRRVVLDVENALPEGTEIKFNCIASTAGERTTWKIICEKGEWIGRQMNCGKYRQGTNFYYLPIKLLLFQQTRAAFSGTTNPTW